jgi:beta-aspartyl-dipeptidase (metallo-type)
MSTLILLKSGEVYGPEPLGVQDVLIAGNQIAAIGSDLAEGPANWPVEVVDCSGKIIMPGLIDLHTHMTGGGGEAGASTKVPAPFLSSFTMAGVTTAVGLLGTDGTTRSISELLAAARGLSELGLNALCYTGSYDVPPPTLTGSVKSDIVNVDRIIALGELAISDHRSSQPTFDQVVQLAAQTHVAGMMTGKAGLVHFHLGDGDRGLEMLRRAASETELPRRTFHPTHVNRNPELWKEAMELTKLGFTVDITAFPKEVGERGAGEYLAEYIDRELPMNQLTLSSDGGGCLPTFDGDGVLLKMGIGSSSTLLESIREAHSLGAPLEKLLATCTANAADLFRFHGRGRLEQGGIADLVICTESLEVESTLAEGRFLVRDSIPTVRGVFES